MIEKYFDGKRVAIVGSAPSVLQNEISHIDSHDVVVRINNFKLSDEAGWRTDVFFSFFGKSIRVGKELLKDTYLCMCKCPNGKIESEWHERTGRKLGNDFRYIYEDRKDWWFCETYIPTMERFMEYFSLLDNHIPTTGFSCILDISRFDCEIYLTGFDFFSSRKHNVDQPWRPGNKEDPIGHVPEKEKEWIMDNKSRFIFDERLKQIAVQR